MGTDEDDVAVRVGEALESRGEMIATAESATGGLVCSMLTDVPGSSAYMDRGFVTYAYDAKVGTLGIDRALLDEHGAVSEVVARRMAAAARDLSGSTWGVSVTGVAGPTGGSKAKPVGTMHIGVAFAGEWGSQESFASASHYVFEGDRMAIKRAAAEQALADVFHAVQSRQ